MSRISIMAQPGPAFIGAFNDASDRRLAQQAAQMEQAAAQAQARRTGEIMNLLVGGTGPQSEQSEPFQASFDGGWVGGAIPPAQEAPAAPRPLSYEEQVSLAAQLPREEQANAFRFIDARQRQTQAQQERENTIFQNGAQAVASGRDAGIVAQGVASRLNISVEEAQERLGQFAATTETPARYERIERGDPRYPAGGRGTYQVNLANGQVTPVGNTAPLSDSGLGALGRGVSNLAAAVAGGQAMEGRGARDRAVEARAAAEDQASTILLAADAVSNSPTGAFGWLGGLAGGAAGVVEQVLGRDAGSNVAQVISGATADDLAALRAITQVNVAQSVALFTGEESGRITAEERAIAAEIVGVTENLSTRTRAMEGLAMSYPLAITTANRQALLSRGTMPYPFINADGGVDATVVTERITGPMSAAGFSEEQITEAIRVALQITRAQMAGAAEAE